jgi:hypothetical protein
MTTDHSPSLDEIREAAEKAMTAQAGRRGWEVSCRATYPAAVATYIAMMDPQTTLGLLSRLEAARDALREIWWISEGCSSDAQTTEEQHEAMATEARAALESLRAFTEANPTPGEDD